MTEEKMKFCKFHKVAHPVSEFGKLSGSKDGLAYICKEANREKWHQYASKGKRKQQRDYKREYRKRKTNLEGLLTEPRGKLAEEIQNETVSVPRRINVNGEWYVHLGDLSNILRVRR